MVSSTWVQRWRFWQTCRMMSAIWVLWLLIYMRALYFWLTQSRYDFPLMDILDFSGFQKRNDESSGFNCNNWQTWIVLRNTSGIADLVNDSHPLWKPIQRNSICLLFVVVTLIIAIRALKHKLHAVHPAICFFNKTTKDAYFRNVSYLFIRR